MNWNRFFSFLALTILAACATIEDCQNDPNRSKLRLRFNHSGNISFESISINDQNWTGSRLDTAIFDLPIDTTRNLTQYRFITDSMDYGVDISYDYQIQIFEIDCTPSFYISDLDTVNHTFDSLTIIQTVLTNTSFDADIEVYF